MRKAQGMIIGLFLVSLLVPGCSITEWMQRLWMNPKYVGVRTISTKDLKAMMDESVTLMVINVLPKESYDDCRIKGSLNVPLAELEHASESWDKEQKIVVYCASYTCNASEEAYLLLKKKGFNRIWDYAAGMKEWRKNSYECVGPCTMDYLK